MKFGLLSFYDNPLERIFMHAILKNKFQFVIIRELKTLDTYSGKKWTKETNNFFDKVFLNGKDIKKPNKYSSIFVKNHNEIETFKFIKKEKVNCLVNLGTTSKISKKLIDYCKHGIVNVHPGDLPRYRGSSCVEWAILNDHKIKLTAHFMSEKYDSGPIIKKKTILCNKKDNYQDVKCRVFEKQGLFIAETMMNISKKKNTKVTKNNNRPKYTLYNSMTPNLLKKVIIKLKLSKYKFQVN